MLKHPFAVRFTHHWNPSPVWETFWTQTAKQAIAQAKQSYMAMGETTSKVEIINVVQLEPDQAIMPPDVRRHNAEIVSRSKHKAQNHPETPGFSQRTRQNQRKG